ncbi:MAG: BtrH N-terminal domain-containing protein [Thermodesulfobacteriota bacterium]|jgi:hypothetical protein
MNETFLLKDFTCTGGKHCQTTAMKGILDYSGYPLSEEMLLGLGGGIGFIYWYIKLMSAPFIGGRNAKPEDFTLNICKRIGAKASLLQTSSKSKGYEELKDVLRIGKPAYLFVDMVYFPYFALPENSHFGAHTIVVFGIDEMNHKVYIADRGKKAMTVTIEELEKARNSKFPPYPPKNKLLKIQYPIETKSLEKGIVGAIKDSCDTMLHPPIKNIGLLGMQKWAKLVIEWPKQFQGISLLGCLFNTFVYIEIGGTGGSAFRPMYARFLKESAKVIKKPALLEVAELFEASGELWSRIAKAALPDSWSSLKRIRELMIDSNRIFEEQEINALEKMKRIGMELNEIMGLASQELSSKNREVMGLLKDLQDGIQKCSEKEQEAFKTLEKVMHEREVN